MTQSVPDSLASRVSDAMIEEIRRVPYFRDGAYRDLDVRGTLDYFLKRFVRQVACYRPLHDDSVVADVGAGFGWLSMAFAMATEARVIAVEPDAPRLAAAARIAGILGLAGRIDWRQGRLGALPLRDREAAVTLCIEVLEHTGRSRAAVRDLARISDGCLLVTTPNLLFPMIAHDTRLPFCHWLPFPARRLYARLFGRTDRENDNLFWSPFGLDRALGEFRRRSSFLQYPSLDAFEKTFPLYVPYGGGQHRGGPGRAMRGYYGLLSRLGPAARPLLPNLAAVYERVA